MKNGLVKKAIVGAGIVLSSLLPMKNAYSQSEKIPEGFGYGKTKMVSNEGYEIAKDSLMGKGYVVREDEISRKNPTGLKITPSEFFEYDYSVGNTLFNPHSDVTYVPQKTGLTQIKLKTDTSSVFALSKAIKETSDGKGNPVGRDYVEKINYPEFEFLTYKAPNGKTYIPFFVSPESDEKVANGQALNMILGDSATIKLVWTQNGEPMAVDSSGEFYQPILTKKSDKSKVFATETKEESYLVNVIESLDSLTGDTANYFSRIDTAGGIKSFVYEIPTDESSLIDKNKTQLLEQAVRKRTIEEGQNLVLNYNFPEAFKQRIQDSELKTGEYLPTGETPKPKKPLNIQARADAGVNGHLGGLDGIVTGGASFDLSSQIKIGPVWVGPEFSYTPFKVNESTTSKGADSILVNARSNMYLVQDSSETVNSKTSYPYSLALNFAVQGKKGWEFFIAPLVAYENIETSSEGEKTTSYKRNGVMLSKDKAFTESPILDKKTNLVPGLKAGVSKQLGKNLAAKLQVGTMYNSKSKLSPYAKIGFAGRIGGRK